MYVQRSARRLQIIFYAWVENYHLFKNRHRKLFSLCLDQKVFVLLGLFLAQIIHRRRHFCQIRYLGRARVKARHDINKVSICHRFCLFSSFHSSLFKHGWIDSLHCRSLFSAGMCNVFWRREEHFKLRFAPIQAHACVVPHAAAASSSRKWSKSEID